MTASDATLDDVDDDEPDDDDTDDDQVDDLVAREPSQNRLNRRLRRAATTARERATAAEAELATLRQEVTQLKAQNGSVAQLRQSILAAAARAEAVSLVIPEALDDIARLVDLTGIKVGVDGAVDYAEVRSRVADFVKSKPYLRSNGGAQSLPGGHRAAANGIGPGEFNDAIRRAAGR